MINKNIETKTLMKTLIDEGYPKENIFHHYSDLYVFVTPMTQRIINQWCKNNGYHRDLFVSTFYDQVTNKLMYDIAFQYDPYWTEKKI